MNSNHIINTTSLGDSVGMMTGGGNGNGGGINGGLVNSSPTAGSSGYRTAVSPSTSFITPGVNRGRSRVWNEFVITGDGNKVTCKRCGDTLSYSHSHSTSSMLKHLKRKHHMDLYPEGGEVGSEVKQNQGGSSSPEKNVKPKKSKAKKQAKPVEEVLPPYQEEPVMEPSIQHDPLLFVDPCVRMRWADHSDTCLKNNITMYNQESYTDCVLVAEKQMFKGHRMILSSASETLDEMFKMTPALHHPIIFLNNVKAIELRILLDFIYKGEVAIPANLIPGLVKAGSELKVKGLSDFVWSDHLASTIFPMGNMGTGSGSTYQTEAGVAAPTGLSAHVNRSMGVHDHIGKAGLQQHTPVQTNAQKFSYTTATSKPNQLTGSIPPIQKSYGRVGSSATAIRPGGNVMCPMSTSQQHELGLSSDNTIQDHSIQSFKRMKLISTSSITPSISSTVNSHSGGSFMTSYENKRTTTTVPDTVLMVTNEGETVLSTSHGGVTLMAPNSISLPVSFSIKDDHGMSVPNSHTQFVGSQPVTILSSCTTDSQGLEEVVYSITEVPGGGHEVLMSGPISSLNDQSPIIVYDPGDDGTEKKLFADTLHKE